MVMWTLPPSLLRTQRRPKRPLPHRLLTHHRLPSPTLVLQSVPGRSNQPGGHTDDSGLFRVPPNRFQDPMGHTPNASQVRMAGASTSSGSAPSSGRLNLLLPGMPEALSSGCLPAAARLGC